ncbi:hypothetical protein NXX48_24325 [Bacteroides faecis]|uniref:hypothetical protein n=1 Tax=Bacteroides faecis TaxID=674529 RepID=UPI0021662936|nr:hypothetical protein [Bacteroides faecis]MCS2977938.1 hypothetical protein [Bacteroides faecis]
MPLQYFGDKDLAYGNIRQMNQFLVHAETNSTFPEDKNLKWEAQVRFFRAYVYFQLANVMAELFFTTTFLPLMIKHGVRQLKHGSSLQMIWTCSYQPAKRMGCGQ